MYITEAGILINDSANDVRRRVFRKPFHRLWRGIWLGSAHEHIIFGP